MYKVLNKDTMKVELIENFVYFQNKDTYSTDLDWKKPVKKVAKKKVVSSSK